MPTDPTGSLYLSRIQDFTAAYPGSFTRRKPDTSPTVQTHESSLQERAHEYDRALKQSQYAARRRGAGSTFLGMSTLGPRMHGSMAPSASSIFGAVAGAKTVVLGDSQGSVQLPSPPPKPPASSIPDEDVSADGLVDGSYVDGDAKKQGTIWEEEEGDGSLDEGGVIGLLAQIYARRDGPSRI